MKTTLLVRSLLVLMLLAAVGCGDWSKRSGGSGLLIEPEDAARLGYAVTWSTDLNVPRKNALASVTLLDDTLITIEAPGNLVSAISLRDGAVLWRRVIGESTESVYPPVRDDEYLYLNNDTVFYTVSIVSGELVKTSMLSNVVETGPVLMDRFAIFGAANGTVFAHDIDTGYAKWSYLMSGGIVVPPIASERYVFVADSKGVYASLEATSGELIFRQKTYGSVTATPASARSGIYIASKDQSLYAVNRLDGRDLWVHRTASELTQPPAALGQSVYLPLPGKGLVSLGAENGTEQWTTDFAATAVGVSNDKVLLHYHGGLRWVDESTGRVLADVPTMKLQTVMSVPDKGGLLLVSPGGRIHRLLPKR